MKWKLGFSDGSGRDHGFITDENDEVIVRTTMDRDCYTRGILNPERDGALLAAAPELLEFAERAIRDADDVMGGSSTDRLILQELADAARAVIAKAKGEKT
ncbi:hypothetical protein D3C85_802270 [compost metagenome]